MINVAVVSLRHWGPNLAHNTVALPDAPAHSLLVRAGDVLIPKLNFVKPLKVECQHFKECIRIGRKPLTDGYNGLVVGGSAGNGGEGYEFEGE